MFSVSPCSLLVPHEASTRFFYTDHPVSAWVQILETSLLYEYCIVLNAMPFENSDELLENVMHLFWVGSSNLWFVQYSNNIAQKNCGVTVMLNNCLMNVCKVCSLAIAIERGPWSGRYFWALEMKEAILRASCRIVPAVCVWNGICLLMKHAASPAAVVSEFGHTPWCAFWGNIVSSQTTRQRSLFTRKQNWLFLIRDFLFLLYRYSSLKFHLFT